MDKDICDLAQCLQDLRKISALWQSDIQCECDCLRCVCLIILFASGREHRERGCKE